jgi:hypothetical protein
MAHFLPVSKIVVFGLKSAVKPLSKFIVAQTKNNPHFIKGCEKVADANKKVYTLIYDWSGNKLPKSMRDMKPLTNIEAVEFCADLLGELLMLSFGAIFIYYELKKNQAHKQKAAQADKALEKRIEIIEEKLGLIYVNNPRKPDPALILLIDDNSRKNKKD